MKYLLFLFLPLLLFAVVDKPLQKPDFHKYNFRTLHNTTNYPALLDSNTSSDSKNIFLYSKHFRVIFGKSYQNSTITKELANRILEYGESVWSKEIEEFGFQKPHNTDRYYIDIYIANRGGYNFAENQYMNISSNYAGFATYYPDGTPYLLLNPDIEDKVLQVTIAHEFFHAVQYSYFNGDVMSDEVWNSNIWFLEATAVLMEDEVFPENNDYVSLLENYINNTYRPLDHFNGLDEYGKVLLFKYFKEKNGDVDILKVALSQIDEDSTFLDILEKYIPDFPNRIAEFAQWLISPATYFQDGNLYPVPPKKNIASNISIGKYGILYIAGDGKYYTSSNPLYIQQNIDGESQKVDNLNSGVATINISDIPISTKLLRKNIAQPLQIQKGWNMVGNIWDRDIELNRYFSNFPIVWIYRDNQYVGYSENETYRKYLVDNGIYTNLLYSGEGAWVYSFNDENISIDEVDIREWRDINSSTYQLVSISGSAMPIDYFSQYRIFHFENGTWRVWNFDQYPKLETIEPNRGYFIKAK